MNHRPHASFTAVLFLFFPLALGLISPCAAAQDTASHVVSMTLDECMAYAVEHSAAVGRQRLEVDNARHDYIESLAALLPSVGGGVSAHTSYGLSINPETNTYAATQNFSNSYSVDASMPLFCGLVNVNAARAARLMRLVGMERERQVRDQTAMEAMRAYVEVVYCASAARLAAEQLEASREVLRQAAAKLSLGLASEADVALVEAQVASDELSLAQRGNQREVALLALKERMNFPVSDTLLVVEDVELSVAAAAGLPAEEVASAALAADPRVAASTLAARHAKLRLDIARGALLPSFHLVGGYSTRYYTFEGVAPASFGQQFRSNGGAYVGASVSVPLFQGLRRSRELGRRRNYWRQAEIDDQEARAQVQLEVARTLLQRDLYASEARMAAKKVASAELAHRASSLKFAKGVIGPIELQATANQLLQAKSELLTAQLNHYVQCRMAAYYSGEPLVD